MDPNTQQFEPIASEGGESPKKIGNYLVLGGVVALVIVGIIFAWWWKNKKNIVQNPTPVVNEQTNIPIGTPLGPKRMPTTEEKKERGLSDEVFVQVVQTPNGPDERFFLPAPEGTPPLPTFLEQPPAKK